MRRTAWAARGRAHTPRKKRSGLTVALVRLQTRKARKDADAEDPDATIWIGCLAHGGGCGWRDDLCEVPRRVGGGTVDPGPRDRGHAEDASAARGAVSLTRLLVGGEGPAADR